MYHYCFVEVNYKGDVLMLDGVMKVGVTINDLADMGWQFEAVIRQDVQGGDFPLLMFKKPNTDRARNIAEVEFSYIGGSREAKHSDGVIEHKSGATL